MANLVLKEKPEIKPFLQNTLNPSELEKLAEHFTTGWTTRYNTVQISVFNEKSKNYALKEKPEIKPFLQNTLNPSELENYRDNFTTGWTTRYNTVQTGISKN